MNGDKNLDPGVLTDDERYIYYEIFLRLEESNIVWPKYGFQTIEELALQILRTFQNNGWVYEANYESADDAYNAYVAAHGEE